MTDILNDFLARAASSELFAGGLALGVIGAAVALLRAAWSAISRLFWNRVCISVTLTNRSTALRHFCHWLDASDVLGHVRRVEVLPQLSDDDRPRFLPAPGRYWFFHRGRPGLIDRNVSERTLIGQGRNPLETITITLPFGNAGTVAAWVMEGARMANLQERIGPTVHVLRREYWEALCDVPRRGIDTILAEDDRIERLLADLRRFYAATRWYADRGVPWRRGYLLYGPPGTGKSSAIRALASELDRDIATLDIGRSDLSDDALTEAMACAPQDALLAIEDVDAVFSGRTAEDGHKGVSFSGLLNAIDGVAAQEGRALIMTTNHRDRLDPALIRPGRADLHVELGPVGAAAAARLFERFFPGESGLARRFQAALGPARLTPATLQGWLLANVDDPPRAASAAGLTGPASLAAE